MIFNNLNKLKFQKNTIHKYFSYTAYDIKQKKSSLFKGSLFDLNNSDLTENKNPNRQKLWDDLYSFEKALPIIKTTNTDLKGKALQAKLKLDYYEELILKENNLKKNKYIPRMGDKVELEYYLSLSSGKINRFTGVIVAIHNKNSPEFAFTFYTKADGYFVTIRFNYFSDIIKSIVLVTKSTMNENDDYMIGYKKLGYAGQRGGLILKGGKYMRLNKTDVLNLKESLKTEEDQNKINSSTIYDL
jgi:ribosomal protein L19